MKKFTIICAALLAPVLWASAQNGYQVNVSFKTFKNQYLYLGYYFGKTLPIKDSVKLDANGNGVFKGKDKLPAGIYLVGFPNKKQFFELLIEKYQRFSITITDTVDINNKIVIKGAPDALQFQDYQRFMDAKGREIASLNQPGTPPTAEQQNALEVKRKQLNDEVQAWRTTVEKKDPNALLPVLFGSLKEPIVPEASKHPGGKYDSAWAWYYYKSHYWDGINFADERLLRTPAMVFENRFDRYFKEIVFPAPDSISKAADQIFKTAVKNKEMFKFLMSKLIQRYINPEYMGQDAVYVHLFNNYVVSGQVDWYDEKQKKYLFDRGYSLIANTIGEKAAPLELVDTAGSPQSLYNIKSNYVVICFWDATCGHCKEVVPKVDSIFQAKWKQQGITLLGVMTDGGKQSWLEYIRTHNLTGWVHAYEPDEQRKADAAAGRANYRQLYDVVTTPKLFLLDKDKRIIAKQLTYDQLNDLLQKKMAGR
jgi:peroxiredoxin